MIRLLLLLSGVVRWLSHYITTNYVVPLGRCCFTRMRERRDIIFLRCTPQAAMLENINLEVTLSREEYKRTLPWMQRRLYDLEKTCWDEGASTIVVFEGWDAAGKGTTISTITQRLDARGFKLYPIVPPRTYEQQRPWLWRFWLKVPNRGEMVIFDRSWYGRVLGERVEEAVPRHRGRPARILASLGGRLGAAQEIRRIPRRRRGDAGVDRIRICPLDHR